MAGSWDSDNRLLVPENLACIYYGNQSFSHNSSKLTCYALQASGEQKKLKRIAMHHVVGGGPSDAGIAADKKDSGVYGTYYRKQFPAKENTLILISATQTVNGAVYSTGSLLLRLRSKAALIALQAKLPPSPLAKFSTICAFTGRADIVDITKPILYGIPDKVLVDSLGKSFIKDNMTDTQELAELFKIEVIAGEKSPLGKTKKITTVKGEKIIADHRTLKRRIKI